MSPEAYIYCSQCDKQHMFEIDNLNLPEFSIGKQSYKYPKDKEIDETIAKKLINHHIETGKTELHAHRHFKVIIDGNENTHIIARSGFVEYYNSGPTLP